MPGDGNSVDGVSAFMSDSNEKPKVIPAAHVEVLAADGHTIQEAKDHAPRDRFQSGGMFGGTTGPAGVQMKVIRGGPMMLLLLPILIPVLIIGFILLMIFAMFFGRTIFKSAFAKMNSVR